MAVKIYTENAICRPGTVLMNGTGGSAPALDENPDWPTRYTRISDPSMAWRAQSGGLGPAGGTYQFDYDFGSAVNIGAAGFCLLRCHPPTIIPATLAIQAYRGSSYPPGTSVSLNLNAASGNSLKEFTPASSRYWRVEIQAIDIDGAPIEISGNPWLVEAANIIVLDDPSPGTRLVSERIVSRMLTPARSLFSYEPAGQVRGAQGKVLSIEYPCDITEVTVMKTTLANKSDRYLVQDYEGNFLDGTPADGTFAWRRVFQTANATTLEVSGAS